MVDSQEKLSVKKAEPTAKTAGLAVVLAVIGLIMLRKLSVSVSV